MKTTRQGAVAQSTMAPGQQLLWAMMLGGIFTVAAVQIATSLLG